MIRTPKPICRHPLENTVTITLRLKWQSPKPTISDPQPLIPEYFFSVECTPDELPRPFKLTLNFQLGEEEAS